MSEEFAFEEELYEFPGELTPETWEYATEAYPGEGELAMESEFATEAYAGEGELAMESELALELLEITTEEELDQFLGKLARGVIRGASKFVRSPIGKAIGGVLRTVAKKALPIAGGVLGNIVAPGLGGMIGSKLGSVAGGLLEADEAELMGEVAAQQEAARRYVRFATAAYRNAARTPRSVPPRAAARAAVVGAARAYAPSLLGDRRRGWRSRRRAYTAQPIGYEPDLGFDDGAGYGDTDGRYGSEGRWVRRGNRVVLIGL
jgi:hypothetical protein